jgi:hypothetical protein
VEPSGFNAATSTTVAVGDSGAVLSGVEQATAATITPHNKIFLVIEQGLLK